jgi:hypothetical protein
MQVFSGRSATIQRCLPSLLLFNIVLEVLSRAMREEKEIGVIQIGKRKPSISVCRHDFMYEKTCPEK